jgi:hypothetical protein
MMDLGQPLPDDMCVFGGMISERRKHPTFHLSEDQSFVREGWNW